MKPIPAFRPTCPVVLVSIVAIMCLARFSAAQIDCTPRGLENQSNEQVQGVTEGVSLVGNGVGSDVIGSAIGAWTSACGSSSLPSMMVGGSNPITVEVFYHSGSQPAGSCGRTDVTEVPSSHPDFPVMVGEGTSIHLYEHGNIGNCNVLDTLTHEIGHLLGLGHSPYACGSPAYGQHIMGGEMSGLTRTIYDTECDMAEERNPEEPPDDPPPDDPPPDCPGGGASSSMIERAPGNLGGSRAFLKVVDGPCTGAGGVIYIPGNPSSPIVVDLNHRGFRFTSLEDGVWFDLNADGEQDWTAWTDPETGDAFLVLDRNANGLIDDGAELFGDNTAQPPSDSPNGYEALGLFDLPDSGGNGDGFITEDDTVYSQLRLWVDQNHDAVSQPEELLPLADLDISSLDLDYRYSRRSDRHGNLLKYLSRAYRATGGRVKTVDVFFRALVQLE